MRVYDVSEYNYAYRYGRKLAESDMTPEAADDTAMQEYPGRTAAHSIYRSALMSGYWAARQERD